MLIMLSHASQKSVRQVLAITLPKLNPFSNVFAAKKSMKVPKSLYKIFHQILNTLNTFLDDSVRCKRSFLTQSANDNKQCVWFTAEFVTLRPQNVQQTAPSSFTTNTETPPSAAEVTTQQETSSLSDFISLNINAADVTTSETPITDSVVTMIMPATTPAVMTHDSPAPDVTEALKTSTSSDVASLKNVTPTSDTEQEASSSGSILPSDIDFRSSRKPLLIIG